MKKELTGIPVGDLLISKDQENIIIDIFTAKASLILGKTGENVEAIKVKLHNKL